MSYRPKVAVPLMFHRELLAASGKGGEGGEMSYVAPDCRTAKTTSKLLYFKELVGPMGLEPMISAVSRQRLSRWTTGQ